ncbi:hypothetical protein GCM10027046_25690 [Uliginosibacterium flavum]|uniref:Uncharacterized protein n=1 Tax=Uliginosibacterium flavum TaxID=1396831 RepID=A0ABV2TPE3_9RHOO
MSFLQKAFLSFLVGLGVSAIYLYIIFIGGGDDYVFTSSVAGISAAIMVFLYFDAGIKKIADGFSIIDSIVVAGSFFYVFYSGLKSGEPFVLMFFRSMAGALFMIDGLILSRRLFRRAL